VEIHPAATIPASNKEHLGQRRGLARQAVDKHRATWSSKPRTFYGGNNNSAMFATATTIF
jgi:hypothetical protein